MVFPDSNDRLRVALDGGYMIGFPIDTLITRGEAKKFEALRGYVAQLSH
jgi:hypothetical protein